MFEMTFWNPIRSLQSYPRTVSPLFDEMFRPSRSEPEVSGISRSHPKTDVYETSEGFVIRMEAPGLQKGDIQIKYEDGRLTITGRMPSIQKEGVRYHIKETLSGEFTRSFNLPDTVSSDNISAEVKDGVLTVKIPKREEVKPRRIDVKVA